MQHRRDMEATFGEVEGLPQTRAESIDAIMEQIGCDSAIRPDVKHGVERSFEFFHHHEVLFRSGRPNRHRREREGDPN